MTMINRDLADIVPKSGARIAYSFWARGKRFSP